MPGDVKRKKGSTGYRVTWGGKTVATDTSKSKGEAQLRLLRGIKHGWKPTGKKKIYKGRRRRGTLATK